MSFDRQEFFEDILFDDEDDRIFAKLLLRKACSLVAFQILNRRADSRTNGVKAIENFVYHIERKGIAIQWLSSTTDSVDKHFHAMPSWTSRRPFLDVKLGRKVMEDLPTALDECTSPGFEAVFLRYRTHDASRFKMMKPRAKEGRPFFMLVDNVP